MKNLCSNCFKKNSLKMVAEDIGIESKDRCHRCGKFTGKIISEIEIVDILKSYFESGSVDLKVGNHQPKYRLIKTENKPFENLALDDDLIQDCRMLHELSGYAVDLNYSRFNNIGLWGCYSDITEIITREQSEENYDKLDAILTGVLAKCNTETIRSDKKIFRIKKNLDVDANISNANIFDPYIPEDNPKKNSHQDRFSVAGIPVFYGALDISTCLFECNPEYNEELTLGIFEASNEITLLDLDDFKETVPGSVAEDLCSFISRMLYQRKYGLTNLFSAMALRLGIQGFKYCSYFSKIRSNRFMNVAIFGTPVRDGILTPVSFDRVTVDNVELKYSLGPIFQKQKEEKMIRRIVNEHKKEMESIWSDEDIGKMPRCGNMDHLDINIHSLATLKRICK